MESLCKDIEGEGSADIANRIIEFRDVLLQ